jgi:hypothetical protein
MRILRIVFLVLLGLIFVSCGSESKPTVVTVDGSAPSTLLPLAGTTTVTLDVADNEQRRLITLTPGTTGLSGTFRMPVLEWVQSGGTAKIRPVTLVGAYTYNPGSQSATMVFTTTSSSANVVEPSFAWATETMTLFFTNGKIGGSLQSTKATANAKTESFSGSFTLSGHIQ